MLAQFVKNCSLWEGPKKEKFVKYCVPWVGLHTGAGEEREEEGAVGTNYCNLTATCIPHPTLLGGAGRRVEDEVEPAKKEAVGRRHF